MPWWIEHACLCSSVSCGMRNFRNAKPCECFARPASVSPGGRNVRKFRTNHQCKIITAQTVNAICLTGSNPAKSICSTMSDVDSPAHNKCKAGLKADLSKIWKLCKQIPLPPEKAEKAKRNDDAECSHCGTVILGRRYKMQEQLSLCVEASNSDCMEADSMHLLTVTVGCLNTKG